MGYAEVQQGGSESSNAPYERLLNMMVGRAPREIGWTEGAPPEA